MINRPVFVKQLFYFAVPALIAVTLFSSCQKTSTTTSDIGDWAAINEFKGSQRTQAVSFTIDNTVYVGTGYNGNNRLTDFYKFDETSQRWTAIAPFPGIARNGAVGFAIGNKGFVGCGYDGTNYLNDFYEYDAGSNQWSPIAPFPDSAKANAIGFAIGSKGYVGGGTYTDYIGSTQYVESLFAYDTTTQSWIPQADLRQKRTGSSVFVYGGLAYVVGGTNSFGSVVDMEVYNPTTNTWGLKRPIITIPDSSYSVNYGTSIERSMAAAFLISDTAYLATGNNNGAITGTTWAYDIKNDVWFPKTNFEGNVRQGAIGFNINNHGYLVTGDNGGNYYDDLWQFFPDATVITSDNTP